MAKASAKKAAAWRPGTFGEPEFVDDVEQGSDEWFALRLGIPTASCFSMVVRDSDAKTRARYMRLLAGEILTGKPSEGARIAGQKIATAAMERGKEMEGRALQRYSQSRFEELERVGFVRRRLPSGRYAGCSPDALFDKRRRAVEVKTMQPDLMIERLENGAAMPAEHRWQVYGTMFVADLEDVDLVVYYDGMPVMPRFTVRRDEKVVREISDAIEVFDHELDKLVKRIRAMG